MRVGTGAPQCASGMQRGVGWGMMTVWGVCTLQSTFSKTGNFLTILKRNADPMVFKARMKRGGKVKTRPWDRREGQLTWKLSYSLTHLHSSASLSLSLQLELALPLRWRWVEREVASSSKDGKVDGPSPSPFPPNRTMWACGSCKAREAGAMSLAAWGPRRGGAEGERI